MITNISQPRQKLLLRVSIILNLSLILYLSLSAGWNVSSRVGDQLGYRSEQHYARGILNKYFEKKDEESFSIKEGFEGNLDNSVTTSPIFLPQGQTSIHSISPNVTCLNKPIEFQQSMRSNYWILYNYIRAERKFNCNESITYTTHGDFTFMDNLEPLLERWQGPISVAVYAPGSDLEDTVDTILYYRDCTNSKLVRDLATFHIFFDMSHIPANIPRHNTLHKKRPNCQSPEGLISSNLTYRHRLGLSYPVNVARNVARITASTHFVFPSDIELYPNPNLIKDFLEMIRRNDRELQRPAPRVFVSSIFEISANHSSLPASKHELVSLLNSSVVIPFHKTVCPQCHKIPKAVEWPQASIKPGMSVFYVGKRIHPFQHWEPIYIGTNSEPLYDERLSWEGRSDKMAQGFKLCLLNYEFHILDNAFLIHKPGIKTKQTVQNSLKKKKISAQNDFLKKTIMPEIKKLYGARKGCEMF